MTHFALLATTLSISLPLLSQAQFREEGTITPNTATNGVAVDLNDDGDTDLLLIVGQTLELLDNDGSGSFTPINLGTIPSTGSLAVGDFDNDGDTDAILVTIETSDSRLVRNQGANAPTVEPLAFGGGGTFAGGTRPSVADYDGDGDLDYITTPTIGNPRLFLNGGNGFFVEEPQGIPLGQLTLASIAVGGDFDGDGDTDYLISTPATLFVNDGAGTFQATTPPSAVSSFNQGISADFNGDGITDLLATSPQVTTLFLGAPSQPLAQQIQVPSFNLGLTFQLHAADFDDDGDLDVVGSGFSSPPMQMAINDGQGNFTNVTKQRLPARPLTTSIVVADVDGDQDPDLVVSGNAPIELLRNHHRQIEVKTQPSIGNSLELAISYAPVYGTGLGLALPAIGPRATVPTPSPFGTIWMDSMSIMALPFVGVVGLNGDAVLSIPIPNAPGLAGLEFVTQALVFEPLDLSVPQRLTGFADFAIQ